MLTNKAGNVFMPTESQGHISLQVYKSKTTMADYLEKNTPENAPDTIGMHIGEAFSEAAKVATCAAGELLSEKMDKVLESVIVEEVIKNPRLLVRTKWDAPDIKVATS